MREQAPGPPDPQSAGTSDRSAKPRRGAETARRAAEARIEALRTAGTIGTVGLSFVLAIVIGSAVGWWLDELTGSSPVFLLIFFFLGLVAGVRNVYTILRRFLK